MGYLTTSACTANALYTSSPILVNTIFGIPDSFRRASDFHLLTITGIQGSTKRTTSMTFQQLANRSGTLPAAVTLSPISALPGGYKRLEVAIGALAAEYNGATTLRYSAFSRLMSVTATRGY